MKAKFILRFQRIFQLRSTFPFESGPEPGPESVKLGDLGSDTGPDSNGRVDEIKLMANLPNNYINNK